LADSVQEVAGADEAWGSLGPEGSSHAGVGVGIGSSLASLARNGRGTTASEAIEALKGSDPAGACVVESNGRHFRATCRSSSLRCIIGPRVYIVPCLVSLGILGGEYAAVVSWKS